MARERRRRDVRRVEHFPALLLDLVQQRHRQRCVRRARARDERRRQQLPVLVDLRRTQLPAGAAPQPRSDARAPVEGDGVRGGAAGAVRADGLVDVSPSAN